MNLLIKLLFTLLVTQAVSPVYARAYYSETSSTPSVDYLTERSSAFGANTLTYDSQTNLEWLDLSITKGKSYDVVSAKLSADYAGFHIASFDELNNLLKDGGFYYGATNLTQSGSPPNFDSTNQPIAIKGIKNLTSKWAGIGVDTATGSDTAGNTVIFGATIANQNTSGNFQSNFFSRNTFRYNITSVFQPGTTTNNSFGVALVRVAPVPEPETYAMLLVGLGLIGAVVKRRKEKQA